MGARQVIGVAVGIATVAALALLGVGGADAAFYGFDPDDNVWTVEKIVEGPQPTADTLPFVVEVTCVSTDGGTDIGPIPIQFDHTGLAVDNATFSIGANYECRAVETNANGATVSYACAASGPANPVAADDENAGEDEGPDPAAPAADAAATECIDDQTARFGDVTGGTATFTVTNTFEEPSEPVEAPSAPVVSARPAFTG